MCTIFVLYAPREGVDLEETVEVCRHSLYSAYHPLLNRDLVGVGKYCVMLNTGGGVCVVDQTDVMWWPRFVLSILLYTGTAVAVLAYVKDVVFFRVDRKARVIVR